MTLSNQDIITTFTNRFTAKKFDPSRTISDEDWNTLLEAARLSPTSFGFEPWNIIVVQDVALRETLRNSGVWGAQGTLPTASHFIIFTAKTGEALTPTGEHITRILTTVKHMPAEAQQGLIERFTHFLDKDFALTTPTLRHQWAARQAYIALGNMLTVAALRGIDSQPIEGFDIERVTAILTERGLIDPAIDRPVVMASFGYRDMDITPKTRRPLNEVVTWA